MNRKRKSRKNTVRKISATCGVIKKPETVASKKKTAGVSAVIPPPKRKKAPKAKKVLMTSAKAPTATKAPKKVTRPNISETAPKKVAKATPTPSRAKKPHRWPTIPGFSLKHIRSRKPRGEKPFEHTNLHKLKMGTVILYFSYETLIALKTGGGPLYVCKNVWGQLTENHTRFLLQQRDALETSYNQFRIRVREQIGIVDLALAETMLPATLQD